MLLQPRSLAFTKALLLFCATFASAFMEKSKLTFPTSLSSSSSSSSSPSASPLPPEWFPPELTEEGRQRRWKQKVAVVGTGAIGSYYGARLWEIGHKVQFHVRGEEKCKIVKENGLNVTSIHGNICIPANEMDAYSDTSAMEKADWVIVALKSSSLDAIPDLIYPLLQPSTRVVAIMNGLIEDDLIQKFKEKSGETSEESGNLDYFHTLYGGMAFVCCNRKSPGVVDHSFAGFVEAGVAYTRASDLAAEKSAFMELWNQARVEIKYEDSLLRGRWRKMIWNLPFNGISVAMGGITVDMIVNDPGLRQLAYRVMDETIAAANAEMKERVVDFVPFSEEDRERMMAYSDKMGPYKTSTMLDLVERRSMEVKYLFRKPVERAHAFGVPVPHLETLVFQIEAMQRHYNLM